MSALTSSRGVSSPLRELQPLGMDGKYVRPAGIAIMLLRSVIVAACIVFGLHRLAIRPGVITTVVPAAALSVAVWMVGGRLNFHINNVASASICADIHIRAPWRRACERGICPVLCGSRYHRLAGERDFKLHWRYHIRGAVRCGRFSVVESASHARMGTAVQMRNHRVNGRGNRPRIEGSEGLCRTADVGP